MRMRAESPGQGLAQLAGPANVVSRVLFSPDSTLLVATGSNGTVRVWNVPVSPETVAQPAQPTPTPPPVIEPTPAPAGFPTPVQAQVQGAEQVFEHGRMFWIRHLRQVWVMAAGADENSGDWFCFNDAFQEGDPETDPSLVPPEGLYQPKRGFGLIWREKEGVRDRLGWALTPEFVATLNRAGPFGAGNPEPVVALPSHQLVYAEEVGQAHLRLRLKSGDGAFVNAIAFRTVGQKLGNALLENRGQPLHVAGSLTVDRWQGAERVQLRVMDAAVPDEGPSVIR